MATQRNNCKDGKLTAEKIDQLNRIGFRWRRELTDWQQFYNELAEYTKKQGHCNVPHRWADNKPLSTWLAKQRRNYRRGLLTPDKIILLENLGIWWYKRADWQKRYYELINYKQRFGDCNVPHGWIENKRLAEWIRSQRRNYKDKILSQDHIHLLNALGFDWVKSQ